MATSAVAHSRAVRRRASLLTVRVLTVPQTKQVSRAEASALYEVVSDIRLTDEF